MRYRALRSVLTLSECHFSSAAFVSLLGITSVMMKIQTIILNQEGFDLPMPEFIVVTI